MGFHRLTADTWLAMLAQIATFSASEGTRQAKDNLPVRRTRVQTTAAALATARTLTATVASTMQKSRPIIGAALRLVHLSDYAPIPSAVS